MRVAKSPIKIKRKENKNRKTRRKEKQKIAAEGVNYGHRKALATG